ncbi:MAG: DUF6445 family protein [Xanthomonadales bacterium]|nr:DUF6445 family protein [Xanthomonadales bacterium]
MPTSMIIVDDFLADAHALRQAAMNMEFPEVQGQYPGRNSSQRVSVPGLDEHVSRLVGEPLRPLAPQEAHGKFRIALAEDIGKGKVHVDRAHWSGILYLSLPEHCQGGTEFFRHIPTNTERAPYNDQEAAALGGSSARQWVADVLEDSNDDSKWEMTMRVPMRFNRLILLRPWLWHTAGENFGDSLENGRLVYLLFYASAAQ